MTETPDLEALAQHVTARLKEIGCICPEPGCHFCAAPEVYWPTFRAAVRTMTSAATTNWLRAERARRAEVDERTRARRRGYARRRAAATAVSAPAVIHLDGWDQAPAPVARPARPRHESGLHVVNA